MTREEFVEKHRHELAGFLLDAVTQERKGGELALWLRLKMRAIDARLAQMWTDMEAADREQFPRAVG